MIQPISNDHEMLACFNQDGNEIEPKKRSELHNKPYSIWHGVSDIWIVNIEGKILCSKRSEKVSGNPGKWQSFFGGHVKAGTDFLETALRELEEEIGINIEPEKLLLMEHGKAEEYKHIYYKFVYLFDTERDVLDFRDGEITETKWFLFKEYWQERIINPEKWCNGINEIQYQAILQRLGIS